MSCTNCKKANKIPAWVHELTVAKIADASTSVYVVFRDITQSRKSVYPATSTSDGTVKLDLHAIMFPDNHSYEITIARDAAGDDTVNMTIGGEIFPCISARFEKIWDDDGEIETILVHTITME